jgi:hypothetical protein
MSELMQRLECMIHFLNQAIEMEAGAMVRECIGSAEHRMNSD